VQMILEVPANESTSLLTTMIVTLDSVGLVTLDSVSLEEFAILANDSASLLTRRYYGMGQADFTLVRQGSSQWQRDRSKIPTP